MVVLSNIFSLRPNVLDTIFVEARYKNDNSKAIRIMCNEDGFWEPYATLTVCVPNTELKENEILVKTYSENAHLKQLINTDMFSNTGETVISEYIEAEILEIKDSSKFINYEEFNKIISEE